MSRIRKDPLRALTEEERDLLTEIARSQSEAASHVARAKLHEWLRSSQVTH